MFDQKEVEIVINNRHIRCELNKIINVSPIVQDFYSDNSDKLPFVIDIDNFDSLIKSKIGGNNYDREEVELNNICKVLNGEEINVNFDNYELFQLIAKYFHIYPLIQRIEKFANYLDNITPYIEESEEIDQLQQIENFLRSLNEMNYKTEISDEENTSFLSQIDEMLLIQAILGIFLFGTQKTYNKFIIELVRELSKIHPGIMDCFTHMIINKIETTQFSVIRDYCNNELFLMLHQLFEYGLVNEDQIDVSQKYSLIFVDFLKDKEKIVKNPMFTKIPEIYEQDNYKGHKKVCELGIYTEALELAVRDDNIDGTCTIIEYAAFFGSIKCFKYLLNNGAEIYPYRIGKYAIAGGNEEIIHICNQEHSSFKKTVNIAIRFHHNPIAIWLIENKLDSIDSNDSFDSDKSPLKQCLESFNIEMMTYFLERGQDFDSIVNFSSFANNVILLNWALNYYKNHNINFNQFITYDIKGIF